MSEDRRRILNMLAEGKITADEAERLLEALGRTAERTAPETTGRTAGARPKYLRVIVQPKQGQRDQVNIRIPLALLRAGVKLGGVVPDSVKGRINEALAEKGFTVDLGKLNMEDLERLIDALGEMSIDVDDERESVRVCCE
ncbi:MAG TPA: hypothetical protein PLR32_03785 [candidate division Zixibacteria bacterium]|mgnify:CR=1 FL=1|nr:hypothetical protein [candidate division Zixibacteria bacterium]MDD4917939.1 hypothetical protein [candidate division Zixibacteria bacterium]MDM7972509.1 hypothetical protein [candidate division Zixibacteria bacterium]HOD65236.1 hypothetical protein [candidate division Zixibacteria bacterium]HPC10639.1 hypothetical protein [candidate division Zixibacteria bacterium]